LAHFFIRPHCWAAGAAAFIIAFLAPLAFMAASSKL